MNYICPICGKERTVGEPFYQPWFGWFACAYCNDCRYIFAEVRNASTKEKAIEKLQEKTQRQNCKHIPNVNKNKQAKHKQV